MVGLAKACPNYNKLGEMHGIEGQAWCFDRHVYTYVATTDDLHMMQFDIVIIKHREQNMYSSVSVYKQQCMMVLKICTGVHFMKTGDINSKVITAD